ncbi:MULTISPECIES: hypothetical protein [unclassified Streptomyces]|uniref:hypothetical protein n=1 Tax=unclassified Streptomyces TaxID=2593676 RepID=UPI002253F2A6|nr:MULTISPECIES: hypothetical protein [unclassified Streptomyces]MCX4792355.1 hypothetical protein [Streptomyces sp. NBC_01221]WSP67743.1 hypothetical protein OG466_39790 [Streptomyces sp. NBC_01240]
MTVAVVVPVILLALGAEARMLDERTRPQRSFSPFIAKQFSEAEQFLESFPDASPDWTVEQTRTQWANYVRWSNRPTLYLGAVPWVYFATIYWALTIAALSVTEVWTLVWLTSHHPEAGDWPALAWLSVVSCALGMVLLLAVPTLRLLWFDVRTFSDPIPDSFLQIIERKFGLPADASKKEQQRWLATMNHPK